MSWFKLHFLFLLQEKGNVGLYEPKSPSNNGSEAKSNSNNGLSQQTTAELEKAIGQLGPEQQQQLGRLYMFLTQHPEAKIELQSLGDVRRAMDDYQVGGQLWSANALLWTTCGYRKYR